jgi:hypothetical protein
MEAPKVAAVSPSIFVSYASQDRDRVKMLAEYLYRAGAEVWLDKGEIAVGDNFVQKIETGIKDVELVVIMLSHYSSKSPWVAREIREAKSYPNVRLIPVLIDRCQIPIELSEVHHLDLTLTSGIDSGLAEIFNSASLFFPFAQPLDAKTAKDRLKRLAEGVPRFENMLSDVESVNALSIANWEISNF